MLERQQWLMVGVTCGCVYVILAVTAGAIAVLPDLSADLQASQSEVQWIGDGFPLLIAALLLPAGALLDRYGRKRGLLLGLVVLSAGLVMTWMADSVGLALAGRCVAGVGGAFVFPATLATITSVLGPEQRSTAVAMWAFSMVLGAASGLVACAAIAQASRWQDCFAVLAAVTVLLLVLTVLFVPETRDEHGVKMDPPGAVMSALAVGGLTFAITEAPVHGWTGATTVVAGGLGLVLLVGFVVWERRTPSPMLDMDLLLEPRFGTAALALFVMFVGHFGMYFLSFQYLTYVLDYSPLKASLGMIPPLVPLVLTPFSPKIAKRFGTRRVVLTGLLLGALGTYTCIAAAAAGLESYWTFTAGAAIVWLGMGLAMAPPTEMIVAAVPEAKQGVASAVNDLTRELGAAVGIALAGSAFNSAYRGWIEDRASRLPDGLAPTMVESPAAAVAALERSGGDTGALDIVHDAIAAGWQWAFAALALGFVIGAVGVAIRMPARA